MAIYRCLARAIASVLDPEDSAAEPAWTALASATAQRVDRVVACRAN